MTRDPNIRAVFIERKLNNGSKKVLLRKFYVGDKSSAVESFPTQQDFVVYAAEYKAFLAENAPVPASVAEEAPVEAPVAPPAPRVRKQKAVVNDGIFTS